MITIRQALPEDAEAIARIQVDTWRVTYQGIMPDEVLTNLSYERSTANWAQGLAKPAAIAVVAEDGNTLVGFAYGGKQRDAMLEDYDGELYAIYILSQAHGRGIGRQLVTAFAQKLHDADYKTMLIWVLKDNHPARGFYERLGGQFVTEKTFDDFGVELQEVAYGWRDFSIFTHKSSE